MGGTGSDRPLKLALLGRSNVGKSSLFNRLEGRGRALTAPSPHLTRDCRLGTWTHAALPGAVELVDTPGWQERPADELLRALSAASERAAADADIVALVCDVRVGLLPDDMACAQRLHRLGKPLMLVLNKSDGRARAPAADWARLGLGAPVEVSALHGSGLEALAEATAERAVSATASDTPHRPAEKPLMRVAVLGRPNVGKSTLVNALSGADRLTGAMPGLTREADAIPLRWHGETVLLYDTPGMRRTVRRRRQDSRDTEAKVEAQMQAEARRALQFADIAVVLLEPHEAFHRLDVQLLQLVHDEGRGFVIAINKADLLTMKRARLAQWRREQGAVLAHLADAPILFVSALRKTGLQALTRGVQRQYALWNKQIGTGVLNRWLGDATRRPPPPLQRSGQQRGRRARLRYITQSGTRPPHFMIFGNQSALPEAYLRYLRKDLRQRFRLAGVPLRLTLRKSSNPYARP